LVCVSFLLLLYVCVHVFVSTRTVNTDVYIEIGGEDRTCSSRDICSLTDTNTHTYTAWDIPVTWIHRDHDTTPVTRLFMDRPVSSLPTFCIVHRLISHEQSFIRQTASVGHNNSSCASRCGDLVSTQWLVLQQKNRPLRWSLLLHHTLLTGLYVLCMTGGPNYWCFHF